MHALPSGGVDPYCTRNSRDIDDITITTTTITTIITITTITTTLPSYLHMYIFRCNSLKPKMWHLCHLINPFANHIRPQNKVIFTHPPSQQQLFHPASTIRPTRSYPLIPWTHMILGHAGKCKRSASKHCLETCLFSQSLSPSLQRYASLTQNHTWILYLLGYQVGQKLMAAVLKQCCLHTPPPPPPIMDTAKYLHILDFGVRFFFLLLLAYSRTVASSLG